MSPSRHRASHLLPLVVGEVPAVGTVLVARVVARGGLRLDPAAGRASRHQGSAGRSGSSSSGSRGGGGGGGGGARVERWRRGAPLRAVAVLGAHRPAEEALVDDET